MTPKLFKRKYIWILALVLTLTALLAAIVGTMAWLRYVRSLQTITQISLIQLPLVGPDGTESLSIEPGEIDMSSSGSKEFVFGVEPQNTNTYWLQLAHTTNLSLTYTIYPATKSTAQPSGNYVQEGSVFFAYDRFLTGDYLNRNAEMLATKEFHNSTYGSSVSAEKVQENAEPLYWQCGPIKTTPDEIDYYVLKISWSQGANNKETDMIYLTVGTNGWKSNAGGSQ